MDVQLFALLSKDTHGQTDPPKGATRLNSKKSFEKVQSKPTLISNLWLSHLQSF